MADNSYGLAMGALEGLNKGLLAFADAKQKRQDREAEMAGKGLILGPDGKWVSDPATLAKERRKRIAEANLNLLEKGFKVKPQDFDEEGFLTGVPDVNIDYFKAKASADPMTAIAAALKRRELEKPSLTPAEEEVDKAYGKEYQDYTAQGGSAAVQKNLNSLGGAVGKLKNNDVTTGGLLSILPQSAQKYVSPKRAEVQGDIEGAVQNTLKQVLGAQFTEKEGTRILERTFDPRLPTDVNARRAEATLNQLQQMAEAKKQAAQYYEKNGTLKGFKGAKFLDPTNIGTNLPGDAKSDSGLLNSAAGLIQPGANASQGKIKVSNGTETLLIDPSDLADAQKDGYRPVK